MSDYQAVMATEPSYSPAVAVQSVPSRTSGLEEVITTRFGNITIRREKAIVFPKGLLGMPGRTRFTLVDFPVPKFAQFKLLQSLEEDDLSFICMPIEWQNNIVARADLEVGMKDLAFSPEHTTLFLIVSVHRELKQLRLSVNARAPLFMDAERRIGEQYVLRNDQYQVRHILGE